MPRRLTLIAILSASLSLPACADRGLDDATPRDSTAPRLLVHAPERGAYADQEQRVTVAGRALDDASGIARVTVNGVEAEVDPDGDFEVEVTVEPGITLLQTVAEDGAGNRDTDTRAVVAGRFEPLDGYVGDALAVDIDDGALDVIGEVAARVLEDTDLTAATAGLGPIVSVGGSCFGAEVYVTRIEKGDVAIGLDPISGGLAAAVDVDDLYVELQVLWHLACFDGDSMVWMTADRASLDASVGVGLASDGRITADTLASAALFQNFMLATDLLPTEITDLVEGPIGDALAGLLADQVQEKLGPLVADQLNGLAQGQRVQVLGESLQVDVRPTQIDFDPAGGAIRLDSRLWIPGKTYGMGYPASPQPLPPLVTAIPGDRDFALALADDAVNQLLAAFWTAGALNLTVDVEAGDYAGLGVLFDRVDIDLSLPPVAQALPFGGGVRVVVGDLICSLVRTGAGSDDVGDETVTRIALSIDVTLVPSVDAGGTLSATQAGAPTIWIDVLDEGVSGANPLDHAVVEQLGSLLAVKATAYLPTLLSLIPLPTFQGAHIVDGTIASGAGDGGYLLAGGKLAVD